VFEAKIGGNKEHKKKGKTLKKRNDLIWEKNVH
jgi:hypothetical protein